MISRIPGDSPERFRGKFQLVENIFEGFEGRQELPVGCKHIRLQERVSNVSLKSRLEVVQQLKCSCRIAKLEYGVDQVAAFIKIREGIIGNSLLDDARGFIRLIHVEVEIRHIDVLFRVDILKRKHLVECFLGIFYLIQIDIRACKGQVERFVIRPEMDGVFQHLDGFAGIVVLAHEVAVPKHIFDLGWCNLHCRTGNRKAFILEIGCHKRFCQGMTGGQVIRVV